MHINSTTSTVSSSFANNQEPTKPPSEIISVVSPEKTKPVLTEDIWVQHIFPLLNHRDIAIAASVFRCAKMAVSYNEHITYDAWFSLFTPQQQAAFKRRLKKMSTTETSHWIGQFAAKESITERLKEQTSADYPESFIYNRALSMYTCPLFKVEEKCLIQHNSLIRSATFSADGLHLVTASRDSTARIYGQDSNGDWVLKTIISHQASITSTIFCADDSHVITLSNKNTAKIYGQDSNGKWTEKAIIENPAGEAYSATFSADSLHATFITGSAVQIYGRDSNGEWTQNTIIHHNTSLLTAIFSPDSNNLLITDADEGTQIYELDSSGSTWTKKAAIEPNKAALLGTFSADGSHVAITHKDRSTGIYGQDLNGQWTQKILIKNNPTNPSMKTLGATFSNDSRFVMIISNGNTAVKICGQSSNGEWTEKATIQHKDQIRSFTFSSDSCHVVTSGRLGAVQIYSKIANDRWIQQVTTQYKDQYRLNSRFQENDNVSVAVSADSRQIVISSTANTAITIYGWTSNDEWIKSCILDIVPWTGITQVTFSADGSHLIIVVAHTIKIYGLDSTDHTWKEKAKFQHDNVAKASISADDGHVVTADRRHNTAKIWRLSREENVRCDPSSKKKMKLS